MFELIISLAVSLIMSTYIDPYLVIIAERLTATGAATNYETCYNIYSAVSFFLISSAFYLMIFLFKKFLHWNS